jgi:hypothetical protein
MSKNNHPIEHEELMAYLDGELATDRAVAAAAHLEHCHECQELAGDLRRLSQELTAWEIEGVESEQGMPTAIKAVLQDRPGKPRKARKSLGWKILHTRRGLAWAGSSVAVLLLVSFFSFSRMGPSLQKDPFYKEGDRARLAGKGGDDTFSLRPAPTQAKPLVDKHVAGVDSYAAASAFTPQPLLPPPPKIALNLDTATEHESTGEEVDNSERTLDLPTVPMIARTAGLTLTTKEFDKTRASLEEILKHYSGYLGELKVSAPADAGRTLTATLRIPAPQLEAAMAELKKLGRVEDESQGGEEVTQQYVDLQARLANGKHTEQRLTEILRTRTGKLQDVLKVELEIDRVRGEIEQMQAEKKELSKRVAFATLNTMVKEEYHAKLEAAPPSTGSRFRNAAVDGYNTVVEGLIDVGLFLLSAGPSLLLWAAILFFPARWAWKKLRRKALEPETHSAQ